MEAAVISAYVAGREFEILCILIFARGMFVGGILTKLCCRSVQVIVDSSVEVDDLVPPVFADWLDMHDSYYRTEKGTVLHLTPFCSYAKGRALSRLHFCKKCLKTRHEKSPKPQNDVDT